MSNAINFGSVVVLKKLASDPASAVNGSMYYNTTTNKIKLYENGAFVEIASGAIDFTPYLKKDGSVAVAGVLTPDAASTRDLGTNALPFGITHTNTVYIQDSTTAAIKGILTFSPTGPTLLSNVTDGSVTLQPSGTGSVAVSNKKITGLADGIAAQDAVSKSQMEAADALKLSLTGGTMSGAIAMGTSKITGLGNGTTASQDAATVSQVEGLIAAIPAADLTPYLKKDGTVQLTGSLNPNVVGTLSLGDINPFSAGFFVNTLRVGAAYPDYIDYSISGVTSMRNFGLNLQAYNDTIGASVRISTHTPPINTDSNLISLITGAVSGTGVRGEVLIQGGFVDVASTQIKNLADPTAAQDAASKAYVDAVALGLSPKKAVLVATTADIALATALINGAVVDTVTLATGNRVLVKNQTLPEENGIYIVAASGAASRATDMDSLSPIDEVNGAWVPVQSGSQAGQIYVQYGVVATLGTSAVNFEFYNPLAALVGGDMITNSGSTFSVDLATASGLESSNPGNVAGQLQIKLDGSTLSKSATGLKVAALGIADAEVSATAAIAYSKLALGSSIVNGDIAAGAAIAYSKLALSTSIVNGDIATAAAIAYSKLASLSTAAPKALVSDASGHVSESAVTGAELGYVAGVTSAIQTQLNALNVVAFKTITPAALAASQATFATIAALSFTSAASKSKVIQYEIVDDVTGDARTGKLSICLGASNEIGQSDIFVSSNVAMDSIELVAVNTAGSCVVQYKGTPANACTLKVLSAEVAI